MIGPRWIIIGTVLAFFAVLFYRVHTALWSFLFAIALVAFVIWACGAIVENKWWPFV